MLIFYILVVITIIFIVYKKKPDYFWNDRYDMVNLGPAMGVGLFALLFPITLPAYLFWVLLETIYKQIQKKE